MTPLIGITTGFQRVPSGEGQTRAHTLYTDFTAMVRRAGGTPVALVPVDDPGTVVARIDGLVLTGGGDVDPARYGGFEHETIHGVEPERDDLEMALVRMALERHLPTLAMCRGMQVLATALGGTLVEDIATAVDGALEHKRDGADAGRPVHEVALVEGSRLAAILDTEAVEVNSVHHQSVRTPGPSLMVTGRAPDGIIEALEHQDTSWPMWAVQWHPEWMPDAPASQALFRAVVDAARRFSIAR